MSAGGSIARAEEQDSVSADDNHEPACGGMLPFTCAHSGVAPIRRETPFSLLVAATVAAFCRRYASRRQNVDDRW